ncbi:MAG: chorismate synthase, partial [Thermodesulfobacteriota bacterium]|nr:chorismate synthase [Thermodesulfobacteriota bacterium]
EGFLSNHAGGILGGISTGQPIVMRLAVKPTASISIEQQTLDTAGKACRISVKGRHDPCLCPRIAPVAESMAAITLADAWLFHRAFQGICS